MAAQWGEKVIWVVTGLVFLLWAVTVARDASGFRYTPIGDYQQHNAETYNVLAGNFSEDAAYRGELTWYPLLTPAAVALVHVISGWPVQRIYAGMVYLVSIPVVLLFILATQKLFGSSKITLVSLFALVFVMPWTTHQLTLVLHPVVAAMGLLAAAVWLFAEAERRRRVGWFIVSGVGVALVIYSQTIAAITLCGGITLYQILTRKSWRGFILMVVTSFILVAPYFLPLIVIYHLVPRNNFGTYYYVFLNNWDAFFYGIGPVRFLNVVLVVSGLVVMMLGKRVEDKVVLGVFFFGLTAELSGVMRHYGLGPNFLPEFVTSDFQLFNHEVAIWPLATGAVYWGRWLVRRAGGLGKLGVAGLATFYAFYHLSLFGPRMAERLAYMRTGEEYELPWVGTADWIKKHTSVGDVILADQQISYIFISGMTGRKVVATDNAHANTFVDQKERVSDLGKMLAADNLSEFERLAGKYAISYVLLTDYQQVKLDGLLSLPEFKSVYADGPIHIYRYRLR